jgi:hypothetical protein
MSNPLKGLPPQPAARELAACAAASKNAPSRPCLPAVESLGDRIMLSADVAPLAVDTPPPQVSQILIGMMKGDTTNFAQDLDTLKLAAEVDPKLAKKLGDALLKIDRSVYRFGEALIKGQDVTSKQAQAMASIERQFLKIDAHLARLPQDAQLKLMPSIDALKLDVTQIIGEMGTVGPAPDLSSKDKQVLVKISNDWEQMDRLALKLQQELAIKKATVDVEPLKIKLTDILVSSNSVGDATLKEQLTGVAGEAQQILIGLLLPASIGDVITNSAVLGASGGEGSLFGGEAHEPDPCDPCPGCGLAVVPPRSHQFLDLVSRPSGGAAM